MVCRMLLIFQGINLGEFAIKKVPVGDKQSWLVRMLREVTLLEKLRHQNIVEYKHCWVEGVSCQTNLNDRRPIISVCSHGPYSFCAYGASKRG